MAKLKSQNFFLKVENDEEMRFTSEINVDSSGTFSFTVPQELWEVLHNMHRASDHKWTDTGVKGVFVLKKKHVVHSKTLKAGEDFIKLGMKEHLAVDVKQETVILYGTDIKLSYWKNPDGTIEINGYHGDSKGRWADTKGSPLDREDFYSVGFAAFVRHKFTYTRPSGVKIVYKYINRGDHLYGKEALERLNSFVALNSDEDRVAELTEIPYTEEAGQFFVNVMLGMCKMADQLQNFFTNPELVKMAIKNQKQLPFMESK